MPIEFNPTNKQIDKATFNFIMEAIESYWLKKKASDEETVKVVKQVRANIQNGSLTSFDVEFIENALNRTEAEASRRLLEAGERYTAATNWVATYYRIQNGFTS